MLFHRRRERFKFTEKTHSKLGIITSVVALLLIILYGIFVMLAFHRGGGLSTYFGSAGVVAMIGTMGCLGFSVKSLKEEDSFVLFPRLALFFSVLALLCWGGTYIMGFVL